MLRKQVKALKPSGRKARDPDEDFRNSLYELRDGVYAFPTTATKLALMSAAHQDKGISKTSILCKVWLDCAMYKVRPALPDGVCDMPLTRIEAQARDARGHGARRRWLEQDFDARLPGQVLPWAARITGRFNPTRSARKSRLTVRRGWRASACATRATRRGACSARSILAKKPKSRSGQAFANGKGPMPRPEMRQSWRRRNNMTTYSYDGRDPGRAKRADPQVIGEALDTDRLESGGQLHPHAVVADARDAKSPLHRHFEWDDQKAAERVPLDQARALIRSIRSSTSMRRGLDRRSCAFGTTTASPDRSIADVLKSRDLRERLLEQAMRDLDGWTGRYRELKEIVEMVEPAGRELRRRVKPRGGEAHP